MEIALITTTEGVDFIGKIAERNDLFIEVKEPFVLRFDNGKILGLCFSQIDNDRNFKFPMSMISAITVKDRYDKVYQNLMNDLTAKRSGIVLPQNKFIMPS